MSTCNRVGLSRHCQGGTKTGPSFVLLEMISPLLVETQLEALSTTDRDKVTHSRRILLGPSYIDKGKADRCNHWQLVTGCDLYKKDCPPGTFNFNTED